ncbi:MAG: hypothetical protein ABL868_08780 [Sulfuriferula sp.]
MKYEIFKKINGLHVTIPLEVITKLGGLEPAVFLQHCIFLTSVCEKNEGWFFLNQVDADFDHNIAELSLFKKLKSFESALGISRHGQNKARKKLKEMGLLKEKQMGLPKRIFYKIDLKKYMEWLSIPADSPVSCFQLTGQPNPAILLAEFDEQDGKKQYNKLAEFDDDINKINITNKNKINKTTTNSAPPQSGGFLVQVPGNLQQFSAQIIKLTSCLQTDLAQDVIDEFAASMADSSIKSPIGWLDRVVKKAKAGEFLPSKSLKIEENERREKERKKNAANSKAAHKAEVTAVVPTSVTREELLKTQRESSKYMSPYR